MEERSRDFHDLFSFSCNENVGMGLHRTPETFLSCIHCRFSLATLFPASLAPDFFASSRDNNTTEKFRDPFRSARFASSRSARANLYKLWRDVAIAVDDVFCKVVIPQGKREYERLFSPETTWHPYFIRTAEEQRVNVTATDTSTCAEDRVSSKSVVF